jgi:hypothetical protein
MKVVSTHLYAAPPDAVFAAMTTPEVLVEKYEFLGHHDVKILEHDMKGGVVSIRSRRGVPMEVPSFAKRFFSPINVVQQHDEWDPADDEGIRRGTWQVVARGVPVTAGGTLRLAAAPGGTSVQMRGEVHCSVPLVGGRIAEFVANDVMRTMHGEEAFNDEYLTHPRKRRRGVA